jgi:7,8-dihydropterin-6-yl-methyl-4-(beta-D-ribofuranosyl)aminobenzene 5'-phosphate synthase
MLRSGNVQERIRQMRGLACFCRSGQDIFARNPFGRRQVLRATGAGFVATFASMLTDAGHVATAQPAPARAPVVDRLSVRMVTDNYTDRYSVPLHPQGMQVERMGGIERPGVPPHLTLQGEWGLSMVAESVLGAETRRVMIDFGYSHEVLLTNLGFLGIDPATLDALVLSHGHRDHYGGLIGLLDAAKGRLKPDLPMFVGGEDCFCSRESAAGDDFGVLDRPAILASGIRLMVAEGPAIAADHAITSGQIPKITSEVPLRATIERTGLVGGLGCDPAKEPAAKNTGSYIPDDFQHEIATSYVVRDKGLVVLTSCSHRGVLNSIRQAQASSGVDKLHAVIGGFHLVPPLSDEYVGQTVMELKAMQPDFVVPAHCAGERFYDIARAEMPGRVVRSAVGTRFTFTA